MELTLPLKKLDRELLMFSHHQAKGQFHLVHLIRSQINPFQFLVQFPGTHHLTPYLLTFKILFHQQHPLIPPSVLSLDSYPHCRIYQPGRQVCLAEVNARWSSGITISEIIGGLKKLIELGLHGVQFADEEAAQLMEDDEKYKAAIQKSTFYSKEHPDH